MLQPKCDLWCLLLISKDKKLSFWCYYWPVPSVLQSLFDSDVRLSIYHLVYLQSVAEKPHPSLLWISAIDVAGIVCWRHQLYQRYFILCTHAWHSYPSQDRRGVRRITSSRHSLNNVDDFWTRLTDRHGYGPCWELFITSSSPLVVVVFIVIFIVLVVCVFSASRWMWKLCGVCAMWIRGMCVSAELWFWEAAVLNFPGTAQFLPRLPASGNSSDYWFPLYFLS